MNKTSLGEEGVLAIANALKSGNSKLASLSVSENQVGNKTAIAFGELFESNHTLKVLDLSWNSIKVRNQMHALDVSRTERIGCPIVK